MDQQTALFMPFKVVYVADQIVVDFTLLVIAI